MKDLETLLTAIQGKNILTSHRLELTEKKNLRQLGPKVSLLGLIIALQVKFSGMW